MSATQSFPTPVNEAARGRAAGVLWGTRPSSEPLFEEVAEILKDTLGAAFALVTLVDGDACRGVASAGIDFAEVPRESSLCAATFVQREPLIVPDARSDPRWAHLPVVTGPPHVRFYAGVPVILSGGFAIGAVCVLDPEPREGVTPAELRLLERTARIVARAHEIPIEPDAAAAAALEAARREAQDEFLTLVGHELRTPLGGILGVADLIEPAEGEEPLVEALRHSAAHLGAVIDNVLTFTELRSGEVRLDEAVVDVDGLLDGATTSAGVLAAARGKTVARGAGAAGRAHLDAAKLELAVSCLLSNVVMHGGGEAEVAAWRRPGGGIVVEVSDDGAGIDPASRDAALRAFSHVGDLRRRAADGLGLGLPLTRRLVALHGGEIALLRSGDRFLARIELPPHRSR